MNRRHWLQIGAATAMAGCGRRERPPSAGLAFVANRAGKAIAVVDLGALAVVRHVALAGEPEALASHRAHPAVYVSMPGLSTVLGLLTDKLVLGPRVKLPSPVTKLRFTRDGTALWALLPEAKLLVRLSPTALRVEARVQMPETPLDFDLSLEGEHVAVSLGASGRIVLLDRRSGQITHSPQVGGEIGSLKFRKDARWLMAADRASRGLIFYDMTSHRVGVRIPVHVRPDQLCFKPDGGQLFITGEGLDAVVTVYPYQTEVGSTMLAGRTPGVMAASVFPSYLFVANPTSSTVTILNVATQRVMGATQVGREPGFLTVTPNQEYALVLNRQSGDMSVLHIPTLSARRTKAASLFTQVPVGSEPVAAVVREL